jgi:hypothetical protein
MCRPMRSDGVIIVGVGFQGPTHMHLAADHHMIKALAPDRSYQPFGKAILPGRGPVQSVCPNAHGTQSARDDNAVDSARSRVLGKRLGDLACDPVRRRVGCDALQARSRRSIRTITKPYSSLKPMVGTTNRSMAKMAGAWFRRKVRHP